ncbi:MAG: hypothetical protein GW778_02025 [Alphaproteobacteria bacterium]|nr:hypothetical protein [Alphaproteobacteria bacterium]
MLRGIWESVMDNINSGMEVDPTAPLPFEDLSGEAWRDAHQGHGGVQQLCTDQPDSEVPILDPNGSVA